MAFIVKKTIHGKDYYYLNENKRVEGKVKTKTIAYLGKIKKDAKKKAKEILVSLSKTKGRAFSSSAKITNERQPKEAERRTKEILKNRESKGNLNKLIEERKELKKIGDKLDEITSLAGRRGFFFQTAELYGGKAGFFTYGHLGKALRLNWENLWKKHILGLHENFYEIQSNNILPEEVFKASGHIENFNDPMTECKKCHFRFRADQFLEDNGLENAEILTLDEIDKEIKKRNLKCPKCKGKLSEVKQFNMMFSVNIGFDDEKGYLSPETAQGAYISFKEEFQATRGKLPLGLAIIDKAYRNEISPRQMFFRLREFSQAELQIFFNPGKINEHENWDEVKKEKLKIKFSGKEVQEITCEEINKKLKIPKFYLYYAAKVQDFYFNVLKIPKQKFRFRELTEKERAFYNKIHFDVEVDLETLGGFKEIAGIHYRTDHDLAGHAKVSGKSLEVFYEGKKILPHILELSFGVDRNIWVLLDLFYDIGKEGTMFKLPPKLAPIKAAVFPIVKRKEFEKIAIDIFKDLRKEWNVIYDKSGSIGRRYARNDEIGTPYCITIDEDSLKNKDVTIRDRDTTKQIRVKISELKTILKKLINREIKFEETGRPFNF